MKTDIYQFKEWQNDARRELNNEIDELSEKKERLDNYMHALDMTDKLLDEIDDLLAENERLKEDMESTREMYEEEKDVRMKLEMELNETKKLVAGVANKTSQDAMLKAISTFVNRSKQKKLEKRTMVKSMVMEMAMANGLTLPDDLAQTIDALDDEKPIITSQNNTYNGPVGQVIEHADKIENKDKDKE